MIRVGTKVVLTKYSRDYTYNDCDWKDEILRVTRIYRNRDEHPGYDDTVAGSPLYSLETLDGEAVNCCLYRFDVEEV